MSLQLLPDLDCGPRRPRGRQPVVDRPGHRDDHLECLGRFVRTGWPVKQIAGSLGISIDTAYRWAHLAATYSEALVILDGCRRHPRRFVRDLYQSLAPASDRN